MLRSLVGSEMCIRDRYQRRVRGLATRTMEDLFEACESGDEPAVRRILDAGDVTAGDTDDDGYTGLHIAAENDQAEVTEFLLASKANIEAATRDGFTAMHLAAANGCAGVVSVLLRKSRSMDIVNVSSVSKQTPLHLAASTGDLEVVRMLLAAHADAYAVNESGATPQQVAEAKEMDEAAAKLAGSVEASCASARLRAACERGRVEAVRAMLKGGADPSATDEEGWNALHFAAGEGTEEVVALLLEAGCDRTVETAEGETALDLATEEEHPEEVLEMLALE
eukprot:TRINITY_DN60326_c0_g1_i1.p2 TRINITY_DN60326_c0_g1~~TRINITY_DN60326_c0_g1_i1.p2  ORF type:complete len:281 (-),score=90.20 TRINITY_DN60326_c0_g1_i1:374-1216(-)